MELDELKYQLNSRLSEEQDKSAYDLKQILHLKTRSVIGKLKRSLQFELAFAILCTLLFAGIGLFTAYWSLRIYFGVFSVVILAFIIVIAYLLKRMKELSNAGLPVKANLLTLISIIQEYVKRSFQFTMALLPVCLLFSFYLGYNEAAHAKPELSQSIFYIQKAKWQVYLFFVIYFAGLSVGLYYFTRWYLKKLYGNYLNALKEYVRELDTN